MEQTTSNDDGESNEKVLYARENHSAHCAVMNVSEKLEYPGDDGNYEFGWYDGDGDFLPVEKAVELALKNWVDAADEARGGRETMIEVRGTTWVDGEPEEFVLGEGEV